MNNVNPQEWLADVLAKINEHPINKISALLPHNWKNNQLKNIAQQKEQQ
jgi:transposase